jgi:hypothetical protein
MYALYSALKLMIFKQKKGFANISLGLNYCSMGSSQPPPSRDTVPFNWWKKGWKSHDLYNQYLFFVCYFRTLMERKFLGTPTAAPAPATKGARALCWNPYLPHLGLKPWLTYGSPILRPIS